jgi:hypothetical protein
MAASAFSLQALPPFQPAQVTDEQEQARKCNAAVWAMIGVLVA